jgi:exopolyphosphatase / guanosine-5'-triphosphate,3'-diphosphate pyrophosphatase
MAMDARRFAVIDMGTNTFHLLVAEQSAAGFTPILNLKQGVRIGQGGISKGLLADDALLRAEACLSTFQDAAKAEGVSPNAIKAFATSAVRSASNGRAFVNRIKQRLNLNIDIVDGDMEAAYIFRGVWASGALEGTQGSSLVIDIGGGSVEYILGDAKGNIVWKQSFEIGGQRLVDSYMQQDPISQKQAHRLQTDLREILAPLQVACLTHKPQLLIGASGTFDTLRVLEFPHEAQTEIPAWRALSLEKTLFATHHLMRLSRAQRLAIPGVSELRADMIVVALLLLEVTLKLSRAMALRQSSWALKEGVASVLSGGQHP